MDNFCTSEFWNSNLTWNTTIPLFTSCFLKTAAIWTPIIFFWIFVPIEAVHISRSNELRLPWTFLNVSKLITIVLLILTAVAEMIVYVLDYQSSAESIYSVQYYTPFLILVTLVAVFIVVLFHRKKGIATSGILFLFWLLFTLATGLAYYNVLQRTFNDAVPYDVTINKFEFTVTVIYFPLAFVQLIFNCFSDLRCKSQELDPKENPEIKASFISKITFWWFNSMALLGYKKPLKIEDMWDLKTESSALDLQRRFDKYWVPLLTACFGQIQKVKAHIARSYSKQYSVEPEPEVEIEPDKSEDLLEKLSILKPIIKTFWSAMIFTGILKFIASCITFLNPIILDWLITFISSDEPIWKGFLYAAAMFFVAMIESFFNSQYEIRIYTVAMQIRSCVTSAVYKKALILSTSAKKHFTTGEIVNLMSVDVQRLMDYIQVVNLLWSAPLQIGIALYLLWQQLGVATFGGVTIMIFMIPFNAVISIFIRNVQIRLMKEKDKRTKLLNEILGGIKVLKLYAWEPSFESKIMGYRMNEVKSLIFQAYLSGAITFAFASAPFLVSLASFATFVLISSDNVLDANKAFVSLSLFNILRIPTALLPMIITYTAMFLVSLKRINKFLQSDELDPNVVSHDPCEQDPIIIEDGIFSWSKDEAPVLTDINFRVKPGSLVAIVGQVGSGKSSLLSALLGELEKFSGRVNVNGSIAYVPQQAWIQNATLRKNVLFIKSYEERKYKSVIEGCALKADLEILPGGDLTEIGEKGINLSGGQKQRISLARAVYDDADIYFFDDPLSAVDAHVGKHIFEHVIGPTGMLKKKTRILATHRISVLPEVDCIVVLKDGKITETGSYNELLNKKGAFAEFLIQYLETNTESEEILNEDLNVLEEIAAAVGAPPELKTQLSSLSEPGSETDNDSASPSRVVSVTSTSNGLRRRSKTGRNESVDFAKPPRKPSKAVGTNLTDKEVAEVGSVKWWVYFEYMKAFGYWGFIITFFGFMASTAFSLGTNLWLTEWSNDALDPANADNIPLRNRRLGVYGGLGAGEIFFTLVSSISTNLACIRASRILHDAMLIHILQAPMSFFDTTPMGRILNRFSKDIDTADVTIRFNIRMLFIQAFRAIAAFIIISLETPIFLAAIVPLGVLYYFMQKVYIPTSRQLKRLESITRSPIYTHFSETVTGSTSIRAYSADKQFVEQNYNLVDINNSSYYPSLAASRWLSIRLEFIGYIIVFLSALFAVLLRESLSPGVAGLSVSYALQITGILNMLVRSTADVETNIVAVERCLDYTKTPTEADWSIAEKKPKPDWPDAGIINFNKYSTRYREGLDLVLKDISCSISSKERIGIVGRTGAGKSSLTLALFRIIESAGGNIIIDDLDIASMGLHDLRKKLTIIPQDPVLFTGTLRMNLDPFDRHSDPEIWVALDLAHLKTFVASLEKGLQHDISEGGENLSVGQRQLVCLARALLRKTKVLILDEATAAVDVETDEVIQKTIRTAFSESTVLTIAHRLNTVLDYDRVLVLSQGEIAELDSPKALLQNEKSIFYSMAKDAGLV